jgi:hypothetical protein
MLKQLLPVMMMHTNQVALTMATTPLTLPCNACWPWQMITSQMKCWRMMTVLLVLGLCWSQVKHQARQLTAASQMMTLSSRTRSAAVLDVPRQALTGTAAISKMMPATIPWCGSSRWQA